MTPKDDAVDGNVARLWGDMREFRGEMRARLESLTEVVGQLRTDLRERDDRHAQLTADHHAVARRVGEIERDDLSRRVQQLETTNRALRFAGAVLSIAILGLIADVMKTWMTT